MRPSTYPNTPTSPHQNRHLPRTSWLAKLARLLKRGSFYTLAGFLALITALMATVMILYWEGVLLFLFGG